MMPTQSLSKQTTLSNAAMVTADKISKATPQGLFSRLLAQLQHQASPEKINATHTQGHTQSLNKQADATLVNKNNNPTILPKTESLLVLTSKQLSATSGDKFLIQAQATSKAASKAPTPTAASFVQLSSKHIAIAQADTAQTGGDHADALASIAEPGLTVGTNISANINQQVQYVTTSTISSEVAAPALSSASFSPVQAKADTPEEGVAEQPRVKLQAPAIKQLIKNEARINTPATPTNLITPPIKAMNSSPATSPVILNAQTIADKKHPTTIINAEKNNDTAHTPQKSQPIAQASAAMVAQQASPKFTAGQLIANNSEPAQPFSAQSLTSNAVNKNKKAAQSSQQAGTERQPEISKASHYISTNNSLNNSLQHRQTVNSTPQPVVVSTQPGQAMMKAGESNPSSMQQGFLSSQAPTFHGLNAEKTTPNLGKQADFQAYMAYKTQHTFSPADTMMEIVRSAKNGSTTLELQLEPAHLGKVQVSIQMDATKQIQVTITVDQASSRQVLEQHMPQLRLMLAQQGLDLGSFSMQMNQQQHDQSSTQLARQHHDTSQEIRMPEILTSGTRTGVNIASDGHLSIMA